MNVVQMLRKISTINESFMNSLLLLKYLLSAEQLFQVASQDTSFLW